MDLFLKLVLVLIPLCLFTNYPIVTSIVHSRAVLRKDFSACHPTWRLCLISFFLASISPRHFSDQGSLQLFPSTFVTTRCMSGKCCTVISASSNNLEKTKGVRFYNPQRKTMLNYEKWNLFAKSVREIVRELNISWDWEIAFHMFDFYLNHINNIFRSDRCSKVALSKFLVLKK